MPKLKLVDFDFNSMLTEVEFDSDLDLDEEREAEAARWSEFNRSASAWAVSEGIKCPWCDSKLEHPVVDGMHSQCFDEFDETCCEHEHQR